MPLIHRNVLWALIIALPFAASVVACGGSGASEVTRAMPAESGALAYVDESGCIVRVDLAVDLDARVTVCPQSAHGVTAVTWIDDQRVAYVTPELAQIGWRYYDYGTGDDGQLLPGEGPQAVHAGPVQPYSILGELVEVDASGTVTVRTGDTVRPIYSGPASGSDLALPQLITWSPDAQWIVLERYRQRSLVVVSRDGSRVVEVANASRGLVSWFMPNAGVAPHMDFTCGLPSPATYACAPVLRDPAPGVRAGDVLLSWQFCTGATGYEVEVFSPKTGAVHVRKVVAGTAYRLDTQALAGGADDLRWHVRPLVGHDRAAWSDEGTIAVQLVQHVGVSDGR